MAFINLPRASGSSVLKYPSFASFPPTGISGTFYYDEALGDMYFWNGSAYETGAGGPANTDSLPEGSTNLYFTNSRADSRIALHVAEADPHAQYTTDTEAQAIVDATISATGIDQLNDVSAPTPVAGDVLYFAGARWVNRNLEELTVPDYTTKLDDVGGGVTYVGYAAPGSLDADAAWKIVKLTESGDDLVKEYADGTKDFDKIWDDRATYTYS